MGYYMRGDYYRGDYYRGDPFLGGLIGSAAAKLGVGKVAAKAAKWLLGRVTPGAVKKTVGGAVAIGTGVTLAGAIPKVNVGGMTVDPGAMMPGGEPFLSFGGRKRYRRMNALNPRALKRALRRAEGFEKFARRTVNALYKTSDGRRTKRFKKSTPTRA